MIRRIIVCIAVSSCLAFSSSGQSTQWVEGFDTVAFQYDANRSSQVWDFRGPSAGHMTAGWWAPEQMKHNILSWKTAEVPEKKRTTFAFIGACSALPAEINVGPSVKVTVNGHYALTFTLGKMQNYTWNEGDYSLRYISKRVEFPYTGYHREFELSGNSGIYQLTVPASAVEAGTPAVIEVEILPFKRWTHGWFMVKQRKDVLSHTMETMEGEIESLRRDMVRTNEQLQILGTRSYAKMLGRDQFKDQIIYTNGYRHEHPADMIRLKNGDILLFTREATEHYANDGDIVMVRSRDNGKTWGDRQVVSAIKDVDEREGCGVQLKDGTIVLGVFYNNHYLKDGTYDWKGTINWKAHPDKLNIGSYVMTSTDNGHTWSERHFINTKGMPFAYIEGPTDAPIVMGDGSLLMGVIGYQLNGDPKNKAAVLLRSTDKGTSWKYYATMASDPGGKMGGFVEPGLVRTRTGRIIAGFRNHGVGNWIYMSYSDDDGKTWVPAFKTDMVGHPVDLIQLKDGRIMATYGIRVGSHGYPGGVRACFSSDNGKTWDITTEVQIRNDFLNWDVGYPESMQLQDGSVLTAYYFNLFGRYFIGGTTWDPSVAHGLEATIK